MPMPKTTMHQNDRSVSRQDDIGPADEVAGVQTEPIPHAMQDRTDSKLRRCVAPPDPRHHLGPLGLAEYVSHQ